MPVCIECNLDKEQSAFERSRATYRKRCKRCRWNKINAYRASGIGQQKHKEYHAKYTQMHSEELKTYHKNYRTVNKTKKNLAIKASLKAARKRNRQIVDQVKSKPCADCKGSFPTIAMDFDHVRGEKKANVANLVGTGRAVEVILEEIAKCDVVCSNCHRIRTQHRRIANG